MIGKKTSRKKKSAVLEPH